MPNEDIGSITCPTCGDAAAVRKNKKQKLYINCRNCGLNQAALAGLQNYILKNATMYGPAGAPEPEVKPPPKPAPAPAAEPKPETPKKPGMWENW